MFSKYRRKRRPSMETNMESEFSEMVKQELIPWFRRLFVALNIVFLDNNKGLWLIELVRYQTWRFLNYSIAHQILECLRKVSKEICLWTRMKFKKLQRYLLILKRKLIKFGQKSKFRKSKMSTRTLWLLEIRLKLKL